MGQYYAIGNATKRETISKSGFGAKLMETAWVNNSITAELYKHLMDDWYGDVVVNVGDYAVEDGNSIEKLEKICGESKTSNIEDLYEEISGIWTVVNEDKNNNNFTRRKDLGIIYGVNFDKKEYIDLNILPIDSIYKSKEDKELMYIIDPMALLIAVGNGMGSGDYEWGNSVEEVGRWAGDRIGIVKNCPPEGYTEIKPDFRENEGEYLGHALCSEFPAINSDHKTESLLKSEIEENPIFYLKGEELIGKQENKSKKDLEAETKS